MTTGAGENDSNSQSESGATGPSSHYMESLEQLADHILTLSAKSPAGKRTLIGLAGAPGSGKSTLASSLIGLLNGKLASKGESAVIVPMDGFHLDNKVLDVHGSRAVKGSPPTFDVAGFVSLLSRISINSEQAVYIPVFDRTADLTRNAAQELTAHHSIAVVEGNYLLLDRPVWCEIKALLDCSVMLDVPISMLKTRLIQRWLDHGHTLAEARARALSNDIPNAQLVLRESIAADLCCKSVR